MMRTALGSLKRAESEDTGALEGTLKSKSQNDLLAFAACWYRLINVNFDGLIRV